MHVCGAVIEDDRARHIHVFKLHASLSTQASRSASYYLVSAFKPITTQFPREVLMSGLEVAGLVLGAFPVAIGVLGTYKEVAKRLGFWYQIAAEHKRCDSKLKYHQGVYLSNLKRLLLPLAGLDDTHIDELLKNPTGKCWTEARTAGILEKRLGEYCEIYLQCMTEFQEWIEAMNHKLAFDVGTRQPSQGSNPGVRSRYYIPTYTPPAWLWTLTDRLRNQFLLNSNRMPSRIRRNGNSIG